MDASTAISRRGKPHGAEARQGSASAKAGRDHRRPTAPAAVLVDAAEEAAGSSASDATAHGDGDEDGDDGIGSESSSVVATQEQRQKDLEPFLDDGRLDGDSSEEEVDDTAASCPPPAQPTHIAVSLPAGGVAALGDEHTLNYVFESGQMPQHATLHRFQGKSPVDIVLHLAQSFFESLVECSNAFDGANLTLKDMYAYHALLTLRARLPLDHVDEYWAPNEEILSWSPEVAKLGNVLPKQRYEHIRRHLKGYLPEDADRAEDKGWKAARAVAAVQQTFRAVLQCPGEFLSLEEGIAQASPINNPLYIPLGRARPLSGFRFFLLVDRETNVAVNFLLDTQAMTAETCSDCPGGVAGAIIDGLITTATLPGLWYRVMADNFYATEACSIYLKESKAVLVGGTMQRRHAPRQVHFGDAKRPRPSRLAPRGSLKVAKSIDADIYSYGWMDRCGVYFLDPVYGPTATAVLQRRDSTGALSSFTVPKFIEQYSQHMHATKFFEQVRTRFGYGEHCVTKKYTTRLFEILYSMCLVQAYNIHCYVYKDDPVSRLDPAAFKNKVITGLLRHTVEKTGVAFPDESHALQQYGPIHFEGGVTRRKRLECKNCPATDASGARNTARKTVFYCRGCNVPLHPECFMEYHCRVSTPQPRKRRKANQADSA